jgi:hypothetical protein
MRGRPKTAINNYFPEYATRPLDRAGIGAIPMFSRHRVAVISILILGILALAPGARAQVPCAAEYDLARGVLHAAGLPAGLSHKLDTRLLNAQRRALKIEVGSLDRASRHVETALELLATGETDAIPPDSLAAVNGAGKAYGDCLKNALPVRSGSLRVVVSRYTSTGQTVAVAGARVRIETEVAGMTGKDGSVSLSVPAGQVLHVGADDGADFAGAAEVTVSGGAAQQVAVVMTEGSVAEPNQLELDQIRDDGLLPHDFPTLTLRFVEDGNTVAVKSLGNVLLQTERGRATSLNAMFTVNERGEVVATKPELVRQAMLGYEGTLSLQVTAYDRQGRLFDNSVRFDVGRHRLTGRLMAPQSSPSLNTGRAYIKLTGIDGHVYRTRSDEQGNFTLPYLPTDVLHFEATSAAGDTEVEATDDFHLDGDMLDVKVPMHRNGETLGYGMPANSAAGPIPSSLKTGTDEVVLATITDTTAGKCAIDGRSSASAKLCTRVPIIGPWFDIPQGTGRVNLRIQITTEETVARATVTGGPNRDTYAFGLRSQTTGAFPINPSGDTRRLYLDGNISLPGTSKWIEYFNDFSAVTVNGPYTVRLEADTYNCCVGDTTLQTQIKGEIYITGSCPVATGQSTEGGHFATEADEPCPPTLSVTNLAADPPPPTGYGDGSANNDGHVYSIPRPTKFNHFQRRFSAIVRKTPAEAVLSGDVTLYDATSDDLLTTIRVLPNPLVPIPGTDLYYLPMTFDEPIYSSRVNSTPPPAHFIRYRFNFHAEANQKTADKIVISDVAPIRERALWRMPDLFNDRRFGGGHLNGGDGEPGGDSWASRGAYNWMAQNQALLTRINDISGEHGAELGHAGHGYGTDIDMYHFGEGALTGGDPIGGDVYQRLKGDALTAQDVNHPDLTHRQNAAAALGRLRSWIDASRDGINRLLDRSEVDQVGYILDGGEWSGRRRAAGSGGSGTAPAPQGLLPGWGRDLLRTGHIVYGNGVNADTGAGNWANGTNARMFYWPGHHTHIHVTLDRCIVDSDTCPTSPVSFSCSHAAVSSSPESVTINAGQSTTLSIGVSGDGPFYYQWYSSPLNSNEESLVPNSNSPSITVSPDDSRIYRAEVANNCGDDQSAAAVVTVVQMCVPPAVTTSPSDRSIVRGDTATLTVAATGSAPLSYQWFYGFPGDTSAPIMVGIGSTLTITPNSFATYWARVTNACGTADSASAAVLVNEMCVPITINTQPASKTITDGEVTSLSVLAGGTGPYQFAWFIGASGDESHPVPSSDNYLISVSPVANTDYWVRVTNACGTANSASAHVTVQAGCTPPSIGSQPYGATIIAGQSATLALSANGSAFSVQWLTASGAAAGSGSAIAVSPAATTTYHAHITNACGTVDSNPVTITVNNPPPGCTTPAITTQPANASILSGNTATLSVTVAVAPGTIVYQWYKGAAGDTSLPVGTGTPAYTTDVLLEDAQYWVRVSRGTCVTDSDVATVTVCNLGVSVSSIYTHASQPVNLTAGVYGARPDGAMYYEWFAGTAPDTTQPLQAGPWYQTIQVSPLTSTNYWVRVSDGTCTTISNTATVTTCYPTITAQPQSILINSGTSTTLTVSATGDGLTYQWYEGSGYTHPVGTSSPSFTTPALTAETSYWVLVSGCGTVSSETATVSICQPASATSFYTSYSIRYSQSVAIGVYITGTSPDLQWYQGVSGDTSTPLPGKTASSIFVAPSSTTQYWCRATNPCGTSNGPTITVDVCTSPAITTQPAGVTVVSGSSATLSVTASATPGAISYQWFKGPAGDASLPVGASAPTYATGALTADTQYWVRVTRGACTTDSEAATVTVCDLSASVNGTQSRSGQNVNLTAYVYGARPDGAMNYEWFRGSAPDTSMPWSSGPWYQTIQVSPLTTTNYWVRVSDGTCTTNSNTATVSTCYPTITANPQSSLINSGTSTTLTVAATGDGLTYQWYQGAGTPVGTNSPSFTTPALTTQTVYWVRVSGCGYVDSAQATISICQLPTVTTYPLSFQTTYGHSVTLGVNAGGTSPVLQWYQGASGDTSTPLSGATTSSIVVAPNTTTQYWCRASSQCGTANGPTITVDVCSAPVINTQPANVSTSYNGTATLSVGATASPGTVTYQWFKGAEGDASVPAGTGSSFTTPALTADTQYWVRVTRGACSTDSSVATVFVCQLVAGLNNLQSRSGQSVTLTASLGNARDVGTYSWYRGNAGDTSNPIYLGTSYASIPVAPATTTNYWVSVNDGTCTAVSNTATVSTCIPTITTQPAGSTINSGTPTTLSVTATGDGLAYQWYQGAGTPVGTNSRTLTVSPTVTTSYWVRVTGCGFVDSSTVTLTVCQPATATTSYTTYQSAAYQSVTIGVNVSGNPAPALQWYQGVSGDTSTPLAGKTTSTIVVAPSVPTQYWCRASNQCAVANGPTITVDACTSPVINTQPAGVAIPYNSATTLSVSATASAGTILYQWYEGASGDTSLPRGTASSYTTPVLTADRQYWVRVTRGTCSTDSGTAAVSVCTLAASVANLQSKSGQAVTLVAGVGNARTTPSYTWYRGNAGDTSTPLGNVASQVSVAPTTTTNYWVRVTDGTCTVNSNTATVSTCIPNIITQPAGVLINSGQSTTLTVTATGDGLAYQWYVGVAGTTTTPVGTNSPSLTVSPVSTTTYWVRVSGCQVVNSSAATVTICALPSITYQPGPTYVNRNVNATVAVTASGTNLSYQWYLGASGVTTTPVGTNSNVLTRTYTQTTNVWARVTGTCGAVNSNATTVSVYPPILTQPADTHTTRGTGATFSVYTDANPVSYQWYQGASGDSSHPVSGATNATFTSAALTADTQFFVRLTSGSATTDSTAATAFICPSPTVTVSNPYQTSGAWVTLSVDAPSGNDTYKWYKGNSGDTSVLVADTGSSNSLSVNPAATTNYWVRATNAQCSADSATYGVYVCTPAITSQPQNAGITQGQTTRLSVAANGTPPLAYQWYTGDTSSPTAISGATGTYVDVSPSSTTTYYVRVTSNTWCAKDSNVVTVSVCQLPVITNLYGGGWTNPGYLTSLSVTASGTNLSYQWYRGQTGDMSQPVFSNTAAPTFTASQSAYYWVKVSNPCGSVNSAAVLNSVYAYVTPPSSVSIPSGTHTTLTVYASGTYLSYQWYVNDYGHPIAGATGTSYTTPNLTAETTYYVTVKSGNAISYLSATVSMCVGPLIDYPWSQSYSGGCYNVGVAVNSQDAGNVTYFWYKGASGDTSQPIGQGSYYMWVCPTVTTGYWCRVSFADGSCYTDSSAIYVHW